jgi:diadenylate cyclase
MDNLLAAFASIRWYDVLDIILVAFLFYQVLMVVRGTRAVQMLLGLAVIFGAFILARNLKLQALSAIIDNFFSSLILIVIVLFQNEIRRGLTRIGSSPFPGARSEAVQIIEEVVGATQTMAQRRIGALIVLERSVGLADYLEGGTALDSKVTRDTILSTFWPGNPLHDGALVIQQGRIAAAKCLLPLTKNPAMSQRLGTRHRAAIGLTEESDAVVIVVSEERGVISVAEEGKLSRIMDAGELHQRLMELYHGRPLIGTETRRRWWSFR